MLFCVGVRLCYCVGVLLCCFIGAIAVVGVLLVWCYVWCIVLCIVVVFDLCYGVISVAVLAYSVTNVVSSVRCILFECVVVLISYVVGCGICVLC